MTFMHPFDCLKRLLPKSTRMRIQGDLAVIVQDLAWSYDDLDYLEVVIILLEDRRFFEHDGVDWWSIGRELYKMLTFRRHGGASTIDMQYVRMRTGYRKRTMSRKFYEMFLATLLQERMDKIQILRAYLSEVYLGSGISGVREAARKVFGKARYDLTLNEAAQIASMMVYPRPLSPSENWHRKIKRRATYGVQLYGLFGAQYQRRYAGDSAVAS
jgi:membrane peptidoglycan carboxypeptidase